MAGENEQDRSICTPCRGTGSLISNQGEPHQVKCPWCEGTGRFERGRDAQASAAAKPPPSTET